MKTLALLRRECINWLLILLPFLYILLVNDRLPAFSPLHFSDPDQRTYQVIIFIMGIISVWYVILSLRPGMVPLQDGNHQLQSYRRIITLMLAFGSLLSMTFISEKIGIRLNWEKAAYILAFAYIMVIGNLYPTLRHQFLIGIKNPWTLSDDTIWRKTHHFAGKFYFFVGLAGIIYGILFDTNPVPYMPLILVVFVFSLKYVPMAYSYFLYRQIKKI